MGKNLSGGGYFRDQLKEEAGSPLALALQCVQGRENFRQA